MIKLTNKKNTILEVRLKDGHGKKAEFFNIFIEAGASTEINQTQITTDVIALEAAGSLSVLMEDGKPLFKPEVKVKVKAEEVKVAEVKVEAPVAPVDEVKADPPVEAPTVTPEEVKVEAPAEGVVDQKSDLVCPTCGATFASQSALTRHLNSAHK